MVSDFSLTFEIQYIITKEILLEAFNYNDKMLASSDYVLKKFLNLFLIERIITILCWFLPHMNMNQP